MRVQFAIVEADVAGLVTDLAARPLIANNGSEYDPASFRTNIGVGTANSPSFGGVTLTGNGAANAPVAKFSGTAYTGGTATTTKPMFLIEPTGTTSTGWSTNGTIYGINLPTAWRGRFIDVQIDGTPKMYSDWSGTTYTLYVFGNMSGIVNLYAADLSSDYLEDTNHNLGYLHWGEIANSAAVFVSRSDGKTTLASKRRSSTQTADLYQATDESGTVLAKINAKGVIFPVQAATASAPTYVEGGMYYDTTLHKMRIGGASGWETVTSA